jgi:hypothetical protein
MNEPSALGEIIRSDSQTLEVECHALYGAPPFGSFIRADCVGSGRSHYAVVTRISTGPFDGARVVQAHRLAPGELEQRRPHLPTVLRTLFEARVVGYGEDGLRVPGTAPMPPRLHCFVYRAESDEVRDLTGNANWLRPLLQTEAVLVEDLLVCAVRAAAEAWKPAQPPLVTWGKYLARLLRQDYVTLEGVLQRLSSASRSAPPTGTAPATPATTPRSAPRWEERLPLTGGSRPDKSDPFEEV